MIMNKPIKYYPKMSKAQIKRAMTEIHGVIREIYDNNRLPDGAWFYGMTDTLLNFLVHKRKFKYSDADNIVWGNSLIHEYLYWRAEK